MERVAVKVGEFLLDGKHIPIQSMLNAPPSDTEANIKQAVDLEKAGCEIVRIAIPDKSAIELIPAIKSHISIPLVADIHFDYKLALESAEAGADKIRINPGNIGGMDRVRAVANACSQKNIPIRIGVNGGSLEKEILAKYGGPSPEALVESAMAHVAMLEACDFNNIVISIKSSNVPDMVAGYKLLHKRTPYPLHLGVTEAGTERRGMIKSAVGIGALLLEGIGQTIRVSLTADPIKEVEAAKEILMAVGKYDRGGFEVISCPTCGRTRIDLVEMAHRVEAALAQPQLMKMASDRLITVAVMGCAVNGPGEAREADIGIAGGDGEVLLFCKGEIIGKVSEDKAVEALLGTLKERFGKSV